MDDLYIHNEGSVFLLYALTNAGRNWVAEHIPAEAQTFGNAIVVEHRYIADVVAGAIHDGLKVS
jgi:hypothetical protein